MRRVRGYHILFAQALICLAALGTWWTIFFLRSLELEESCQRAELVHSAELTAALLGRAPAEPAEGPVSSDDLLEVVRINEATTEWQYALEPLHPTLAVQPTPEAIASIGEKSGRRRVMVVGEGALLFLILGVCTFMLYRLVSAEKRHATRMEEFVATVTHEMKTPITGIKSMLQTFAAGGVRSADAASLYGLGLKETERLEHMVENILLSGRLRRGRLEVETGPMELFAFMEEFLEHRQAYHAAGREPIQFAWNLDEERAQVLADPSSLHTVLDNLTDNAFKYGGAEPVGVEVSSDGAWVSLSIVDQGQGFEPSRGEKLFVAFRRDIDAEGTVQHGTGLGLSISRALTREMGGELSAHSDGVGTGSRFSVRLRLAE